jgi:hypothetical protein
MSNYLVIGADTSQENTMRMQANFIKRFASSYIDPIHNLSTKHC